MNVWKELQHVPRVCDCVGKNESMNVKMLVGVRALNVKMFEVMRL